MIVLLLQKTLLYAVPLLIVALAGLISEKSGVINLALEGEMVFGSFVGAIFVYICQKNGLFVGQSQWMFLCALLVSGVASGIFSLLLSLAAINFKADQTIAGTALNMLAPAIVNTVALLFFSQEKITTFDPAGTGYPIINPELPAILQIFFDKAYLSTFFCIGVFILASIWVYKSKTGSHLRACGEHPQAAASVGINVIKMRYLGSTISGVLAGIGGYAYIATISAGTAESSVGGLGFLALAIMIFGNWSPTGIALGALLFGFLKCLGPLSTDIPFLDSLDLPMYFYNIIPYVIVLVVLVVFRKKSGCPKAEGLPYEKGQR